MRIAREFCTFCLISAINIQLTNVCIPERPENTEKYIGIVNRDTSVWKIEFVSRINFNHIILLEWKPCRAVIACAIMHRNQPRNMFQSLSRDCRQKPGHYNSLLYFAIKLARSWSRHWRWRRDRGLPSNSKMSAAVQVIASMTERAIKLLRHPMSNTGIWALHRSLAERPIKLPRTWLFKLRYALWIIAVRWWWLPKA